MNVLLLGARGYLGSYLNRHLDSIDFGWGRRLVNIDTEIADKKYDYFINCASRTSLEYCEDNPEESLESNFNVLVDTHKRVPDAKLISFSSYYVYDSDGVCTELAPTTDKYVYTKHKLQAERFVEEKGGVCFRVGKLFGNPQIDKQKKLTESILTWDSIELDEVVFNPTSLQQVLDVVRYEIRTASLTGVYNLSNKGSCTHAEYGQYINKLRNNSANVSIIKKHIRPFHNYGRFTMDTSKLEKHIHLRTWETDVEEYLKCIA